MNQPNFFVSLRNFGVRFYCQSKAKMRRVDNYVNNLKDNIKKITSAGRTAEQIFTWGWNKYEFYEVDKVIIPKELQVETLETNQRKGQADYARIQEELATLNDEQNKLKNSLQAGRAKQKDLQRQKNKLEKRLNAAQRLISGFSSDKIRWTEDQGIIQKQLENMIGDCLLAAAFFSYLGPLNQEYRSKLLYEFCKNDLIEKQISVDVNFNLGLFLADEAEIFGWRNEGLPADELSVQNGLLITRAQPFPLCIDPQLQVVRWVKLHIGEKTLRTTSFQDPEFARIVENAIQYGMVVLFEGIDEFIDPLITPVLERTIISQGSRKMIKFNDKDLDYDDNFRIFMTTKLTSPRYSPEVSSRIALVNCCVTESGLEEQLLDIVISNEHADKHEEKMRLVKETSENKSRLQTLQKILLKRLSESTGYITDNEQLLATLEETKSKAADIAMKLEKAAVATQELDALCNEFSPVARHGAILFFSMNSLSAISTMYEYSLASFSEVFLKSLKRSAPTPVVSKRITNILTVLTADVYEYVLISPLEIFLRRSKSAPAPRASSRGGRARERGAASARAARRPGGGPRGRARRARSSSAGRRRRRTSRPPSRRTRRRARPCGGAAPRAGRGRRSA
jgi:dynein heavy chain